MNKTPRTEPHNAPATDPVVVMPEVPAVPATPTVAPAYVPRQKTIERQGVRSEPFVKHYPQIRGGICEFCGVLDNRYASEDQYKMCPHFRGVGEMRCSYCDEGKDPTDVVIHAILNITEHPSNPDQLVVCCNSYECSRKHSARFKRSS